MPIRFPQFLRRYNLNLLPVATSDYTPGSVLAKKRKGYLHQGHLRQLLRGKPGRFWETEINPANVVYGEVERTLSLRGRSSLDQMGILIEGGLGRARSVSFTISAVHARTFRSGVDQASLFTISPLIQRLKKRDRASWKLLDDKWAVLESYYATEASVSFRTEGNVDLKAEIEKVGGVTVHGGGGLKWTGRRSFRITENRTVPFAFRGWLM
jgi:hypothetical protein